MIRKPRTDVRALASENPNAVREGVRTHLSTVPSAGVDRLIRAITRLLSEEAYMKRREFVMLTTGATVAWLFRGNRQRKADLPSRLLAISPARRT
jgi:hypothetical protein